MRNKRIKPSQLERERINLSLSLKNHDELKIILINKNRYPLKINERMRLSGPMLCKHLMLIGLEVLQNQFGEVNEYLRKEKVLNEK